jgi:multiple sugar transport system substrate-binding protein
MKKSVIGIIIFILILSLAACSSGTSTTDNKSANVSDNANQDKTKISGEVRVAIAGWQLDNGLDAVTGKESIGLNQFLKDTFNKKYPNIKLKITQIPWESAQAKQKAMLISKDVDVLYTGGAFASQFYQQGLLRDIDDLIKADSSFDPKMYIQSIWDGAYSLVKNGKHYGLPASTGRRMTVYDKQLFEQWGVERLSENPTPEEIFTKAVKMTGKNPVTGETNYGLWWSGNALNGSTIVALSYAFNAPGAQGSLQDPANIKWQLNTPEMVKVLEWLKPAAKLPPPAFVNGQGAEKFGLKDNKIAIALDYSGQNTISDYKATGNTTLLDRFEAVMNLGPKGSGWVSLDPMIMAKDAKNVEATWEVMKFFAGYERHKHWYNNFGNSSILSNQDYVDPKDKFAATAKKIASVSSPTLMDEANPFFSSEIVPAINGFISKAASGSAPDIQTFLDDLQKRAEKWSANQK